MRMTLDDALEWARWAKDHEDWPQIREACALLLEHIAYLEESLEYARDRG